MHTDRLLESCLQAMSSGQEIPPDIARYLARHPKQRAEVQELIFLARRASNLAPATLSASRRQSMQERLAAQMGVDSALLNPQTATAEQTGPQEQTAATDTTNTNRARKWSRKSLAYLQNTVSTATQAYDAVASARIRTAFRDLTPEDIRRYIGDRGEDYLYYCQRFPLWHLIFAVLAPILRGFKRLEKLANLY
jgi:hypothetical protein